MAYRANTAGDGVRDFTNSNTYAANKLSVAETTDENERKKWTFVDKLGRTVLIKQELNATEIAQTYTVYDDFGRVLCVIPPETTKKMINSGNWDYNNATYASMIFKYAYDSRGRMTSKTIPSGGTTGIKYDRLDRPVLTTDASGFQVFTRYDILSRPVITGKYKGAASPSSGDPLFETPNTTAPHYYTSTAFPTDNNLDVYKAMYYDDYDLNNDGSTPANESYTNPAEAPYETAAFLRTRGKPTATRTAILLNNGNPPTTYLTTRTYYDKEYSVIQVNKQNHLSGADVSSNAYDFANRLTNTRRDHTATPPGGVVTTHTIREEYIFDHAGRVRFTRHKINTNKWVVTAAPLYDELNRVQDKRLHASNYYGGSPLTLDSSFNYLQSLDYSYNIRGWLTSLNDPASCTAQAGEPIADVFSMGLDYESNANGATPQYNGNIAAMQWRTNLGGTCLERQQYRFSYDYANRLTAADHWTHNGTLWTNTNRYSESNITFDLNGNIKTYTRRGLVTAPSTYDVIDQLTYTYGDAARPDRLTNMADVGSNTKGFFHTPAAAAYQYDLNGNMTQDNHKGFTFAYNFLNLPQTMTKGASVITMTYTADGEKLSKAVTGGGATKNYVGGIEYAGANLEAIYFGEGRCTPNGATAFNYDYTVKDHLGNARVNFRANGTAITVLESMHYYPFGMLMEGIGTNTPTNDYTYNYKELNDDFGLNLYDYGARWYDASLGRWWSVDPLASRFNRMSPYNYGLNNPLRTIDPDGRQTKDIIIQYSKNMSEEDKTKYNQQIVSILGNLTDDKVSIKDGKVSIDKKNDDGTKKNATRLIRGFAEGFMISGKKEKRNVTITKKADGQENATTAFDTNSRDPDDVSANAQNGKGVQNSIISFDPDSDSGKGYFSEDGEKASASNEMALIHELVHELVHAFRNAMGTQSSRRRGSCNCKRGEHVTQEEAEVQTIMNKVFQPENPAFISKTENPYKD